MCYAIEFMHIHCDCIPEIMKYMDISFWVQYEKVSLQEILVNLGTSIEFIHINFDCIPEFHLFL